MVSPEGDNNQGQTLDRGGECHGRLSVKAFEGQDRLDAEFQHIQLFERSPFQVDLFVTRFSRQLPQFFSWRPDPEAEATDAFSQDWSNFLGFAHPPWCLISRLLNKVRSEEASLVLICSSTLAITSLVDAVRVPNRAGRCVDSIAQLRLPNTGPGRSQEDVPVSGRCSDLREFWSSYLTHLGFMEKQDQR